MYMQLMLYHDKKEQFSACMVFRAGFSCVIYIAGFATEFG